ncbi:disulfide bond formation protein DsbA [Mesorhizobium soli]|uniref:Disulfide bond formation protein DsbA n=1 Tax=Pseudaminobacter soli (ex Li et al. 2025) TaxID=1295366 RepID=A0A2P7S960_9HYPH|nr:DsbA family protein [Mesorhizobium soli]PSJ59023.1 disulfide bond formation protein DsbA [Mesorhizobium soli]
MPRRSALAMLASLAAVGFVPQAYAKDDGLSTEMILNDPADPKAGNAKGDVTIVYFFDYNCPYCKRTVAPLDKVVRADGKVRLVYKDWPILSTASIYGARLALAAHYQSKYHEAHHALMSIPGGKVSEDRMRKAVAAAGVDMARLERDMKAKEGDITELMRRHGAQADALGLAGTPVFLIGPFLVASALDEAGFKQVISDARARGNK